MFAKLFQLVKNNAGEAVINNPAIPARRHEEVFNDASSSIIEVLKNHVDGGNIKDIVKYFQYAGIYNNPLISSATTRFATKLNKFYKIDPAVASDIASQLIPRVMQELIKQSKSEQNKDFALGSMLARLTGHVTDISGVLSQLKLA